MWVLLYVSGQKGSQGTVDVSTSLFSTFSGPTVGLTHLGVKHIPHLISFLLYTAKLPAEDGLGTNLHWHGKLIMEIEIQLYTHAPGNTSAELSGKGEKKRDSTRGFKAGWAMRIYHLTSATRICSFMCGRYCSNLIPYHLHHHRSPYKGHKSGCLRGAVRPGVCVLCREVDTELMESHLIVRKHGCNTGAKKPIDGTLSLTEL